MANVYLWITMIILILNEANAVTLFNWLWSTPSEAPTNVLVADGTPLISIPYETMTEDEKFLREAAKLTNIQVSSPLETCQHKVIMKIKTSCYDMTEEQLAKLSVNLLNCQSAVEGRKIFPCTEEMVVVVLSHSLIQSILLCKFKPANFPFYLYNYLYIKDHLEDSIVDIIWSIPYEEILFSRFYSVLLFVAITSISNPMELILIIYYSYLFIYHGSLKQCTTDMDTDTWNAYHLMSNRARAVCYAARSTQFRALTELTVNKLMQSAHSQIKTLISLKESQDRLVDQTSEALSSLSDGNKALLLQQQNLKDAQTTAHNMVINNLRNLNNEKALIRLGHAQIATMVEDVKEKLENASKELVKQSTVHGESHKEILHDLTSIRNRAQLIWEKIESSTTLILDRHQEAADQYEQMMQNLSHINNTIQFISNITSNIRTEIEQTIRQLNWITGYIGDTGEQLQKIYRTVLHIAYLLIAMITAAFLNAPFWTRVAIMGIVPLNLCSYLKYGLEACLDFISITALIFLITGMHFLMNGIQYIWKSKFYNTKTVRSINQNGLSNGGIRASPLESPLESLDSDYIQTTFIQSLIKKTICNFFITIFDKINNLKDLWSRQKASIEEELSCSYVPAKKSHEDIYDYDNSPDTSNIEYNVVNDVNHFVNTTSDLRYRLRGINEFISTTEQTNVSTNSSRSISPMLTIPRILCNGLTRNGRRCRLFATVGHEFCSRHSSGTFNYTSNNIDLIS